MERVAIPVFEFRVSPVLDSCSRMVLFDVEDGREVSRREISFEKMSSYQRLEILSRWNVEKIICAGISDLMCKFLAGRNIALISGIAGELEEIVKAYICKRLDDPCFVMPGRRKPKQRRPPWKNRLSTTKR